MYTYLSYSDLKSNLNYAIHIKKDKKIKVLMKSCLYFFLFSCRLNSKTFKCREICIFKNIVLSVIVFGRELRFLFSHFFIFYAILEFQRAPCQLPKMIFSIICIIFSSYILASFGSFSCLNASYAKKISQ